MTHLNFENKNLIYSIKVINKFGYQAIIPSYGKDNLSRPLCCGRTYISYGQLDKAASELNRFNDYILENNYYDLPVVGIEPSCLLTFNDEYLSLKNINNIENIEILNGSQGTLYGSNAIGAVSYTQMTLPPNREV